MRNKFTEVYGSQTRALLWFLQDDFDKVDIPLDHNWSRLLAHCLVAQDETHSTIWQWITVDHTPKYAAVWDSKEQNRWRGNLFHMAMHSIIYWANDTSIGLNDCLMLFSRAWEDTITTVRKAEAANQLASWLGNFDISKVDAAVLERFLHCLRPLLHEQSLSYSWTRAKILLNHPRGPQPDPAWQLLSHLDLDRADFFQTNDSPFNQSVMLTIVRTAQALDGMGRYSDARHVLEIGRRRLPSHFAGRGLPVDGYNNRAVMEVFRGPQTRTDRSQTLSEYADARRKRKLQNLLPE